MWRPLGFGEIFDRAITLYFRNFIAFIGLAIPSTIVGIGIRILLDGQVRNRGLFELIVHPHGGTRADLTPTYWWSFVLGMVVIYLFSAFVYNAMATAVLRRYEGRAIAFRDCYAAALRVWPATVALLLTIVGIFLGLFVALAFGLTIVITLLNAILGIAFAAVVGAVAVIGSLGIFLIYCVIVTTAFYAVAIEGASAGQALRRAYERVVVGAFWRALGLVLCAETIAFVVLIAASALGSVGGYLGFPELASIAEEIGGLFTAPFMAIVIAVFYFDTRIRSEGLDLEYVVEDLSLEVAAGG